MPEHDLTQTEIDAAALAEQRELEITEARYLKSRVVELRARLDAALAENARLRAEVETDES